MKKLLKKGTSLAVVLALLFSLIPHFAAPAAAATNYFIPDNSTLASNGNPSGAPTRANSYVSNAKIMSITGTYQYVSSDSMSAKVEQMVMVGSTWQPDPQRTYNVSVNALANSRFEINNIDLYPGFNRVTLKGMQGNLERSDTFYISYDDVPYLTSLKVRYDNNRAVDLNEGASLVFSKPSGATSDYVMQAYLDGVAKNTTRVFLNGVRANVLEDGTFFIPPTVLKPGKNDLILKLENSSNSVTINRTIYYYDPAQPVYKMEILQGSTTEAFNLLSDNKPALTGSAATATLNVGMIVPYPTSGVEFNSTSVTAAVYNPSDAARNATPVGVNTVSTVRNIPGNDAVTMAYKLVEFTTNPYNITPTPEGEQNVSLGISYEGFNSVTTRKFDYLPGQIVIKKISLVDVVGTTYTVKGDLDKAEVPSSDFYIQIETDKDINPVSTVGHRLEASLLPVGTVTLDNAAAVSNGANNKWIFKVTGFPNGQQKVRFKLAGSLPTYTVDINYISKNFIYVDNFYDGQTISVDSAATGQTVGPITGSLIGFVSTTSQSYSVNGRSSALPLTGMSFTIPALALGTSPGQLNFGQNTIIITVNYEDAATGIIRQITKELKLYIVDVNKSIITDFVPVTIPNGGRAPVKHPLNPTFNDASNIFLESPEFVYKNGRYTTSSKKFDLVIRAGGATIVNLKRGEDDLIKNMYTVSQSESNPYGVGNSSAPYAWGDWANGLRRDYFGSPKDFILRVEDIEMDKPGTYIFTIELINKVGARATQKLEIVRELAPYRILSPQATVGDRIVVTKNFVRFDIEAEGATEILIDGAPAARRVDYNDRFVYDYIGLKPDKETAVKVVINRPNSKLNATVNVFYTSSVDNGAQFMEKVSTKYSIFNKQLELTFPKGTILKRANPGMSNGVEQFYDKTNILFGVADPTDGVVERRNDYGNLINFDPDLSTQRSGTGHRIIPIEPRLSRLFTAPANREHFTPVSSIYWISGGLAEQGVKGTPGYKPATGGLNPYSKDGVFTQYDPKSKLVPTKRGELTLKFNESIVDGVGSQITVFHFNDRGEWVNLGGVTDTKKNTITVPFDDFGYYMVAKLRYGFSDVTNHPWARNVLESLYAKGIMKSLRDDFGTDDFTSRGEFAALLVRALQIPLNYAGDPTFVDVLPGDQAITWNYEAIETAARVGIVTGMENRYFAPTMRLTREQAATMIARALEMKLAMNDAKLFDGLSKSFTDAGDFSYYSRPAIQAISKAGIMVGKENTLVEGAKKPTYRFDALSNLTRAEAGQVAVRLLQKYSDMFPKSLN